jgi:hypothetical protein
MSRTSLSLAAAAAVVATAGIALAAGSGMGGSMVGGPPTPLVYKLNAVGGSGQHGTVTLTAGAGSTTEVVIKLTGEPASADEPAHVHTGTCRTPGPVNYPLSSVVHGTSTTRVNAPISKVKAGSVNVHESAAKLSIYVACGNIK